MHLGPYCMTSAVYVYFIYGSSDTVNVFPGKILQLFLPIMNIEI